MSQNGANGPSTLSCSGGSLCTFGSWLSFRSCSEYTSSLSKADLDASLETMYNRLATKFQTELHKTFHALSQEIAALGTRTDKLETKHNELALAYNEQT